MLAARVWMRFDCILQHFRAYEHTLEALSGYPG